MLKYQSGYYSALGGTGYAATQYISSMDLNPAVLSKYNSINFSLSQGATYYGYDLIRISSTVGGDNFVWNKTIYNFEHVALVLPVNNRMAVGIGLFQKLNPQLYNKKRAVTFSDLFTQETYGNVYSLTAGISYKIVQSLSFGMNFNKYFGFINSKIAGDNHNNDADKWVSMENKLSGINFRCGLLLEKNDWSAGLVFETPFNLGVETSTQISPIQLYKYLLPQYDGTDWNQPLVIGAGVSYFGINSLLVEIDLEIRKYKSSAVQINLYEFGGAPVWQDIKILRAGIQYKPSEWPLPLKVGYAYTPQLYYSNNSMGLGNTISSYQNTDQNIKHTFTAGTSKDYGNLSINLTLQYSVLDWHRILIVPQTISDYYTERNLTLSVEGMYRL